MSTVYAMYDHSKAVSTSVVLLAGGDVLEKA